ncbi:MAG: zinc ribbon domain-containing protein [Clostridia bacterium]|nr:zinc ribbon domain-containing protein [Clostridia bacterium]
MRKTLICIVLVVFLSYSASVIAETWICPFCENEARDNYCSICGIQSPLDSWICIQCKNEKTGNFCNECGSPRPTPISSVKVSNNVENGINRGATPELTSEETTDDKAQTVTVKNYVGRNLSSCGYTSLGGDRRDRYADTTILLVLLDLDGIYIDPMDTSALGSYRVVAQYPEADTSFKITTDEDGESENLGYGEIILVVTNSNKNAEVLNMSTVRPSPDKSIQYVRDYKGRMLEDVGYTAINGNRYDKYGPDGYVQIIIVDEQGGIIDPSEYKDLFITLFLIRMWLLIQK